MTLSGWIHRFAATGGSERAEATTVEPWRPTWSRADGANSSRSRPKQSGIVSRIQLYQLGITRGQVRANVRADRWRRVGSQSISMTTGPLTRSGQEWAAVLEAGPRAFLDGSSSLIAWGLRNFSEPTIRVSVPRGARVRRARGLDIRQTRRWQVHDVVGTGVPPSRPAIAAVRGALWARSDKQAALILTMAVQQGLVDASGWASSSCE